VEYFSSPLFCAAREYGLRIPYDVDRAGLIGLQLTLPAITRLLLPSRKIVATPEVRHKSPRVFRESVSARQYPADSEVKEVDGNGQFRLHHHRHYITKALAGKDVGLMEVEHRILVFYRRTPICELDPTQPRSTMAPGPATPAG